MRDLLSCLAGAIFAAMVNERRESFLSLCGLTEFADQGFVQVTPNLASCEVPLEAFGGRAFDGRSCIDVLVRLGPNLGTAFELKLGTTRLTKTDVDGSLLPCAHSSHGNRRWKGKMMAILDRRFPDHLEEELVATAEGERITLIRDWFVVARQRVLTAWQTSTPDFSTHVRLLAFEGAIECFGGNEAFNRLVRGILDVDYYDEWIDNGTNAR